ncbi:methyltransferase domain-containing protein [Vallicoccus soli]|uniref:methyltransferase domain-containing protein n=1 Tax=Vallicoccus soli TaxID=2339232 RepID=UPI001C49825A|nr:methyltransferase domain-containing protein [Vallicoccus soli]
MVERPSARPGPAGGAGERSRARSALRTALVEGALREAVARQGEALGREALDVLDVGGGTGGSAVPLALAGHRTTVVDPSPDALAALERRAAEAGVSDRVRAVQGDTSGLLGVVDAASADVVVCHGVLEHVDDPQEAVGHLVRALRPVGTLSLLAANRTAVVLARALAGHFGEARHALDDPDGRWGSGDPVPRRFTPGELSGLVEAAGLRVERVHGVRVLTDLVPGALVDAEPGAADALLALEAAASSHPALAAIATQLHVLAVRG